MRLSKAGENASSGPYTLKEYYPQRAFDRDFRAATTERPGSKPEETRHQMLRQPRRGDLRESPRHRQSVSELRHHLADVQHDRQRRLALDHRETRVEGAIPEERLV